MNRYQRRMLVHANHQSNMLSIIARVAVSKYLLHGSYEQAELSALRSTAQREFIAAIETTNRHWYELTLPMLWQRLRGRP
jgi:phosphoribosylanthranilate isomerase